MHKLPLLATLAIALSASAATADPKPVQRPTVCTRGAKVTGAGFSGFMCTDGKRPRLLVRYTIVAFTDAAGKPASYVLGWTTKGGPTQ